MNSFLSLADARLLLWLNHWLAANPSLYLLGLFLTDKFADVVTLATFALLWFWPEKKDTALMPVATLPPLESQSGRARGLAGVLTRPARLKLAGEKPYAHALTRHESRAQTLVFGAAGLLAYLIARLIAASFNIDRPFVSYLTVRGLPGAFDELRTFGSFPSDHAALLGALPIALFFWNRRLAWGWTILAFFLAVVRVAVGFHYPKDMLAGAALGIAITWGAFAMYRREGRLYGIANTTARGFDLSNAPYCYILYAALAVVGFEFARHFEHVLKLVFTLRWEILNRLGQTPL